MPHFHLRLALLATAAVLAGSLPAGAQSATVQMFDDPPPLELLRSIMIPESHGGATRRIVIPGPNATQPASLTVPAEPAPPVTQPAAPPPAVAMAMSVPLHTVPSDAAPAAPAAAAGVVGFRINFAFDSDAIPARYRAFVERIGQLMQEQPQVKLRIEGYTDATGRDDYNLALSGRRGAAVATYLVDHMGIDAHRLAVIGRGKADPVVADPYDPRNRRVQFVRVE